MSSKSVVLLWIYCNFSNFQNGRCRHLGIFWNREILLAIGAERVKTHQHAKFCPNRSIGCGDIKIFRFFKMAAAAILDCRIHKISLAGSGQMAQTHHFAKFRENWSFHCGDVAIFRIFKMNTAAILDFWNREILLATRVVSVETHQHAKFCQNRSQRYYDFSIFQDGGRRHLGLSNSQNFIGRRCLEGPYASLYQISSKSVVPLLRYCDFSNFKIGRGRHLGFLKSWNFITYFGR